jgi:hypothetical protein
MQKFDIGDRVEIDGKNKGFISNVQKNANYSTTKNKKKEEDSRWLYDIDYSNSNLTDISENRIMPYADRIMYIPEANTYYEGYLNSFSIVDDKKVFNLELDNGKKIYKCPVDKYKYYCDIIEVQTQANYWEKGYCMGVNIKPNGEKLYHVFLFGDKGVLWSDVKNNTIKKNITEANVRPSYANGYNKTSGVSIQIYGVYFGKTDNIRPNRISATNYRIKNKNNQWAELDGDDIKTTTCRPVIENTRDKDEMNKRSYKFFGWTLFIILNLVLYLGLKYLFLNKTVSSLIIYGFLSLVGIVIFIFSVILLANPKLIPKINRYGGIVGWILFGTTIAFAFHGFIFYKNENPTGTNLFEVPKIDQNSTWEKISKPIRIFFIESANMFKYSN